MFMLAGEEFGLLPGLGFGGDAKTARSSGYRAVDPFRAAAAPPGCVVLLRALRMMASVDGEHTAHHDSKDWYSISIALELSIVNYLN